MTTSPPTHSRFARLARWCFTHRAITIAAWVVTLVVVSVVASSVGQKQISNVRLPGTESQRAYDTLARSAPTANGDSDQIVFRAKRGTLRDPAVQRRVRAALDALRKAPEVAGVGDPLARGGRISRDGRIGVAAVQYRRGVDDIDTSDLKKVETAAFAARGPGLQVEHGGVGGEVIRQGGGGPSEGIGILAAAVVLLITFGSLVAAGIPLLAALLALGSTLGLITLASHLVDTPDFASQLATLIGLGVGIDYSLFVVTRYRTEVAGGRDRLDACMRALDTAGRTVFFAGATVIIALLGLLLLGLSFLHGVAVGAALAVLLTMVGALTLLPAFLGLAGRWIDRLRLPLGRRRDPAREGAAWARWSRVVQRRPWPVAIGSALVLLALAAPALGLRLGSSDAGVDPASTTTRKAYDLIARGFGPGVNGPFVVVASLDRRGDTGAARRLAAGLRGDKDLASVSAPRVTPDGRVAILSADATTGPQDARTPDALHRLRDDVLPPLEQATRTRVDVGGQTASQEDFTQAVSRKLPLFVGVVVALSALLLLVVFRSVVIPVKAALMNLLSIGAALGVVTAIFQDGFLANALGIGTGPIESFLPVLLFAIVFGLSMDYEVFLISRVHEEWERSGDASEAVASGLATTGRVITAAASIMVVVFGSFVLGDDRVIKLFGIGLASAVLLDALIIRCLLVPALMELFGRAAWWLPRPLARFVPRLAIEREG